MRSAYPKGILVLAILTTACNGLLAEDEPEALVSVHEMAWIENTPATVTTLATTTSVEVRKPDVDAMGDVVEDHLGTTTTTTEPDLQQAGQPTASESTTTAPTPSDSEPPPSSQPPASEATTTTAPPPPPDPGGPNGEFESQFASLINSYRSSNGLAELSRDGSLDSRARSWSEQMAGAGGLSHSNIGSLLPPWTAAAENVGMGGSVSAIFDSLAGSSGHKANMLGDYTHYGVGVWVDSAGVIWTTHVFTR
jgi:uncharacterized protein YkwD